MNLLQRVQSGSFALFFSNTCGMGEIAPANVGLAYRVIPRWPFLCLENVTRVVSEMDFRVNATRAVSEMALPPQPPYHSKSCGIVSMHDVCADYGLHAEFSMSSFQVGASKLSRAEL